MQDTFQAPIRMHEAAKRLGLTKKECRNAVLAGHIRAFKIGKAWLIHPEPVDRLLRGDADLQRL